MIKETVYNNVGKELKLGVVLSYFLIALNVISGFLLVPFIIRGIGQSNYGLYTAASALITMFIVDLGLGTAITKFVSKYRVVSNQEEINKVTFVVFTCFIALSLVLLLIFAILFPLLGTIYSSFTDKELDSFRIIFIIVASYSVITFPFSIVNGMLVSYDKIFLAKIADIVSKLIFIVLTILVLALDLGVYFLTACFAIHGFVGVALKLIFVKTKTPIHFFTKVESPEFKRIFKEVISFSIWAAINSFGRVILVSIAPSILGFASSNAKGTGEIAILSIAIQIESYVSLFATTFGSIFYPSISRILFNKSSDYMESISDFQKFHIKIARIQVLLLFIILAGLAVFGQEFVYLWVGEGYEKSYYCILAICLPALLFYPLQTAENAIAAIEKIKYCGISTIISVVIGIVSSIGLAFAWGAIGVSIGICIGFLVRTILFNIVFNQRLNIRPIKFYLESYFSFLIPTIIAVAIGIALNRLLPGPSWIYFIVKAGTVSICYSVFVCAFGLNRSERDKADMMFLSVYKKANLVIGRIEK